MKFMMYLLYKYYSKGPTGSVAYIKTIGTMVFLVFILIIDVLILTNNEHLFLFKDEDSRSLKYLKLALYTLPIFLFFLTFFKEKSIAKQSFDDSKIRTGNYALLIFCVLVILSVVVIPLIKYRM